MLGRCPSLSAHDSESVLRTYLVCREKQERGRERETSKRHVGEAHSVLATVILLPQRLSCYWGRIVPLRMLSELRLATAQQRTTGQNLTSDLYKWRGSGEQWDRSPHEIWPWYLYGDDVIRQSKFSAFGTETYFDTRVYEAEGHRKETPFLLRIYSTSLRIPTRSISYISQLATGAWNQGRGKGNMFRRDVRLWTRNCVLEFDSSALICWEVCGLGKFSSVGHTSCLSKRGMVACAMVNDKLLEESSGKNWSPKLLFNCTYGCSKPFAIWLQLMWVEIWKLLSQFSMYCKKHLRRKMCHLSVQMETWQFLHTASKNKYKFWLFCRSVNILSFYSFEIKAL
jgi:hypothetical protein